MIKQLFLGFARSGYYLLASLIFAFLCLIGMHELPEYRHILEVAFWLERAMWFIVLSIDEYFESQDGEQSVLSASVHIIFQMFFAILVLGRVAGFIDTNWTLITLPLLIPFALSILGYSIYFVGFLLWYALTGIGELFKDWRNDRRKKHQEAIKRQRQGILGLG